MKEIPCDNWEQFDECLYEEEKVSETLYSEVGPWTENVLFRGHACTTWKLETTLERYTSDFHTQKSSYSQDDYDHIMKKYAPYISSMVGRHIDVIEEVGSQERLGMRLSKYYPFMVYMRHHGFPSPLLDWSASPYVAAFFAFEKATAGSVSIYSYREMTGDTKGGWSSAPNIILYEPTVTIHRRHFLQQCQYTVCVSKEDNGEYVYRSHEDVKPDPDEQQDVIRKYIIPAKERMKVLKKLRLMNISAYSLLENEEGLASALAFEVFELKMRGI